MYFLNLSYMMLARRVLAIFDCKYLSRVLTLTLTRARTRTLTPTLTLTLILTPPLTRYLCQLPEYDELGYISSCKEGHYYLEVCGYP